MNLFTTENIAASKNFAFLKNITITENERQSGWGEEVSKVSKVPIVLMRRGRDQVAQTQGRWEMEMGVYENRE